MLLLTEMKQGKEEMRRLGLVVCYKIKDDLRFTTAISVIVLVVVTSVKILWILLLDLLVGHIIANTRVKFIKCLPLQLIVFLWEMASGCNSTLKG